MTARKYRSAMGKTVDIGALMLQNENVRAVGNMGVNARGDSLDGNNRIIDRKAQQIQRQQRKTNVMSEPMTKTPKENAAPSMPVDPLDTFADLPKEEINEIESATPSVPQGGLAAAIAKAKVVQQTKLPTPREAAKAAGVRKI